MDGLTWGERDYAVCIPAHACVTLTSEWSRHSTGAIRCRELGTSPGLP
jgi:hypothetical protein